MSTVCEIAAKTYVSCQTTVVMKRAKAAPDKLIYRTSNRKENSFMLILVHFQ